MLMKMARILGLMILLCLAALGATSPDDAYNEAVQALRAHDLNRATKAIQNCLKLRPDYSAAKSLAAEIHSQTGLDLASRGEFASAVEHFRTVTELQPSFPGGHYNLGLALLNLDDAPGAEQSFRRALKLDPRHAKASAQLANAVLRQARSNRARMAEAAELFRQAILVSPNNPELHFNLAYALAVRLRIFLREPQ